jgi:hypothetical protein
MSDLRKIIKEALYNNPDLVELNPDLYLLLEEPSRSKYKNQPVVLDGFRFASRKEAKEYVRLKLLVQAGEITDLTLQPQFVLQEGKHPIRYIADFSYVQDGRLVVVDVKGYRTKEYRLKRKLFLEKYPDVIFEEK